MSDELHAYTGSHLEQDDLEGIIRHQKEELAALRRENKLMKLLLQEIKKYWYNEAFRWSEYPDWRDIYERLKSYLSQSEGKGGGGGR